MSRQILGSGDDERPPTLMLKDFALLNPGKLPVASHVKIIFLPTKVPNYSLITDHEFRVNIHRTSPLFQLFLDELHQWEKEGIVLQVLPSSDKPGDFSLAIEDARVCDWRIENWGYRLSPDRKRPRPAAVKVTRNGEDGESHSTIEG